jgi:hypothetical protein
MLKDHFIDMGEFSEPQWLCAWRCLDCGHAVDPITAVIRQMEGGSRRYSGQA